MRTLWIVCALVCIYFQISPALPISPNTGCDGWMVIHQRIDGHLNFFRNWSEYKKGFGSPYSEFFIGLDNLYATTVSQPHELYVQLEDFDGQWRYALYDEFQIGSEAEFFSLKKLGNYSGNAGDSLRYSKHMKFSTYDLDNDDSYENCALSENGAWWYDDCSNGNLNGLYLNGNYEYSKEFDRKGMYWMGWRGNYYSYKSARMMIRPKYNCP